jgi:hypothetical protein
MTTTTDQILNNNIEQNNRKIYLSTIFECLDGCSECIGTYFSTTINDYSICKCNCHKDKNSIRLISDNERDLGDEAFAEMIDEYLKSGGDPDVI